MFYRTHVINQVWAEDIERLRSDVWVNIWVVDPMGQVRFYGDCRVSEFERPDKGLDYGLEPVDEDGNPMRLKDVLKIVIPFEAFS